jgi:hypothetical protein
MHMQNEKRATIGKIGLGLSLLPWFVFAMMIVLRPG